MKLAETVLAKRLVEGSAYSWLTMILWLSMYSILNGNLQYQHFDEAHTAFVTLSTHGVYPTPVKNKFLRREAKQKSWGSQRKGAGSY